MSDVIAEAYEMVEEGIMTEEDFRDFVFANPVKLWTAAQSRLLQRHGGGKRGHALSGGKVNMAILR